MALPAVAVAVLLTACAPNEEQPLVPMPTSGAAWGEALIPFDDSIVVEGGFVAQGSEHPASKTVTAAPGAVFDVVYTYRNDSGGAQSPRLRFTRDGPSLTDLVGRGTDDAIVLLLNNSTRPLTRADVVASKTDAGLLLAEVPTGGIVSVSLQQRAIDLDCGSYSTEYGFRITDATGARNQVTTTFTVDAGPCPSDAGAT